MKRLIYKSATLINLEPRRNDELGLARTVCEGEKRKSGIDEQALSGLLATNSAAA